MATTKTIDIRTAIPGPRSAAILERKARVIANAKTIAIPIVAQEGRGATLTDVDGNVFIDLTGGVGCLNVGHAHPRVLEAASEQMARFIHTDFTVVPYEPYIELAERLLALAPFRGPAKAAFFNAGTEAVENAVKFARLYTGRPAVIAFEGAFHGRTLLSMTLTSRPHPYKVGMGPLAPEVYRAPFPQDYRGPDAETALAELRQLFLTQVAAEQVAAIIVEPVQGEAGFLPAPQRFMEGLRAICDEYGICLIADEVQTGFARTGKLFAIEHYDVEPDLITVAKSIAGGFPLSGVLGKAEILDAAHDGAVGGTYVGNPVAQAAALAVLDVIEEEGLSRARRSDRRDGANADARLAGAVSRHRRGARPRGDARDRAGRGPGDEAAGAEARAGGDRCGNAARAPAAEGGRPRERDPRPVAARDHRRRAGRGTRGLGRRARARALIVQISVARER